MFVANYFEWEVNKKNLQSITLKQIYVQYIQPLFFQVKANFLSKDQKTKL